MEYNLHFSVWGFQWIFIESFRFNVYMLQSSIGASWKWIKMSDKKTYFQKCWLQEPDFKPWLQEGSSNLFFFHCKVCKKSCSLANKGIGALKTHMKGDKHREKMKLICGSSSQDTIISHFKPLQKNRE